MALSRRELLASAAAGAGALALGPAFLREALAAPAVAGASPYGPLGGPDANGLMLPPGFTSRLIARGNLPVEGTTYLFPIFPDGQATFRTKDGGWILTTNSEVPLDLGAGASATRFRADGTIAGSYRILGGTHFNCAGGPTPWGTWISCEEADDGIVFETDPAGVLPAQARPALGVFRHEAVAVDPVGGRLYLTEDSFPGGFYRFTPTRYPDLAAGLLEIAQVAADGKVTWHKVPDPSTTQTGTPTAVQVPGATAFGNGEGIWYARGVLYFTTKTDKKVWAYRPETEVIEVLFDRALAESSSLDAVDNVTVSAAGDVLVCEDGGNMEIGLITSRRQVSPLLQFVGPQHEQSEVCGVVFSPDGKRLYCTSQRSFAGQGAVYEISGPFKTPSGGMPADLVFGPPAGEARPNGPLNPGGDRKDPNGKLKAKKKISRRALTRQGLKVTLQLDEAAIVAARLDSADLENEPQGGRPMARPKRTVLARTQARFERNQGSVKLVLVPDKAGRRALNRVNDRVRGRVLVSAVDGAGNETVLTTKIEIGAAG
jgi:secreted PhoX family phosphatase